MSEECGEEMATNYVVHPIRLNQMASVIPVADS
jgi:hypothetical protein